MGFVKSGTIKLNDIQYNKSKYPREKWNTHTINKYADDLKAGDKFPPIILEIDTNDLLDGMHRWKAYQKYSQDYLNQKKEDLDNWAQPLEKIEIEYHKVPDDIPVKLYSARLSKNHGDRLSLSDRKIIARATYEKNPDFKLKTLAKYLGGSISTNHGYVADLLAARKEERNMLIYRLSMLGWTQREIGDKVGLSREAVKKILGTFFNVEKSTQNLLFEGYTHQQVSERLNMPIQLVWAIDLSDKTDQEKMKSLNISIQPYDHWNFGKCNNLFGTNHPGRIPGQLVAHILYFFTEPGNMIVDPMAGSGTTLDTCLIMNRKCYAYDVDQRHNREDIILHDLSESWPDRIKKADLIFWDPPYFKKMDSENIGESGYLEKSISKLSRDEYLSFFSDSLKTAKDLVKPDTKLAFLMSDWNDNENKEKGIFLWDYANIMINAGWSLKRHIQVPLSTQQVHPDIVNKFRVSKKLARLERYLLIGINE